MGIFLKKLFIYTYINISNLGISCVTPHSYKLPGAHSHCKIFCWCLEKCTCWSKLVHCYGGYKASIHLPIKVAQPFSHVLWNKRNISQQHRSFSPSLRVFIISEHPLDQRLLFDSRRRLPVSAVLRQLLQMAHLGLHYKSDQATDPFLFFFLIQIYLIFQDVFFFLKRFFQTSCSCILHLLKAQPELASI